MSPSASTDGFLGGRLRLAQVPGYRAGADPVFLAAAVPAAPGESVLELGCGAGTALFCLGARVGGLHLVGLERDAEAAALARANAAANEIAAEIVTGDVAAMPDALRAESFDHVMMNPPFFRSGPGQPRRRPPGRAPRRHAARHLARRGAEAAPARWQPCGRPARRTGARASLGTRGQGRRDSPCGRSPRGRAGRRNSCSHRAQGRARAVPPPAAFRPSRGRFASFGR